MLYSSPTPVRGLGCLLKPAAPLTMHCCRLWRAGGWGVPPISTTTRAPMSLPRVLESLLGSASPVPPGNVTWCADLLVQRNCALCRLLCHAIALPRSVSCASCAHPSHTFPHWVNILWAHNAPRPCAQHNFGCATWRGRAAFQPTPGSRRKWGLTMRCVSAEMRCTIFWLRIHDQEQHEVPALCVATLSLTT